LGLLLGVGTGGAQSSFAEKDLAELLAHLQERMAANYKLTQQYTSDETKHDENFDKSGKKTSEHTTKFENMVVEGLLYRREVERDGKPLSGKDAAEEQKRYDEAVAERRAMKEGHRPLLLSRTYNSDLPMTYLETLFDNRVLRTESVNGRETVVVESLPKPDAKPKNVGEKSALDWKQTTWIDLADGVPARFEVELLRDRKNFQKGLTLRTDFTRRVDEPGADGTADRAVWLQTAQRWDIKLKMLWMSAAGRGETAWTNFKKFRVDMRLLEETLQEVPAADATP
jgi:hypothetical protein